MLVCIKIFIIIFLNRNYDKILHLNVFYYNNNYIWDILVPKYGMLNQLKVYTQWEQYDKVSASLKLYTLWNELEFQ